MRRHPEVGVIVGGISPVATTVAIAWICSMIT